LDYIQFFKNEYLSTSDLIAFASVIKKCQDELGFATCWCLKRMDNPDLKYFSTSHKYRPVFKGRDARPLLLALVNQFAPEEAPAIVRKAACTSAHCLNPAHYFFGDLKDVKREQAKRKGKNITIEIVNEIQQKRSANPETWTYEKLGKHFKLPYHVIRRICTHNTYGNG
jgi:hypothetical protein